jgi:diguanylate cyclase (GGDEF)-like protein
VDLQHLKEINARHGHRTGDAAICALARALRGTFRSSDLLARLDGDEFVALATTDTQDLAEVARTLATRLQAVTGVLPGEEWLTISVGATECRPGDGLDVLVSRADAARFPDELPRT